MNVAVAMAATVADVMLFSAMHVVSVLAPGEVGYIFDVSQLCGSAARCHVLWCGVGVVCCGVCGCDMLCCGMGVLYILRCGVVCYGVGVVWVWCAVAWVWCAVVWVWWCSLVLCGVGVVWVC